MRMSTALLALATVSAGAAAMCLAGSARAGTPSAIDITEHTFGATNVNAVVGHGGLTAGISVDGDLTMISWPGPTFADQILYLSSNDLDARSEPHFGALDGMGSYVGLLVTTASGQTLVWLRDSSFSHVQGYTQPDAPVVATTFTRSDLGLTVVLTDVVTPDVDLLTRRVVVTRSASSPVTAASLVLYENLSPTVSLIPEAPLADWLLGWANDFVAVYDETAHAIVHMHPSDRGVINGLFELGMDPTQVDYGPIDALMSGTPTDAQIDGLLSSLDTDFAPGVAALITTDPPPTSFQVGADATPFCAQAAKLATNISALPTVFHDPGLEDLTAVAGEAMCTDSLPRVQAARGWTWAPQDALANLGTLPMGTLSGSRLAACQTNGALIAPLTFQGDTAEGDALFAFGKTVAAARATLAQGTSTSASARQTAAEQAGKDALAGALLPDESMLGAQTVKVAQRALVNMYVARDRTKGAIVASVTHQPPYYLDWPRDGSFIMHALDVAGVLSWPTTRAEWYATIQRQKLVPFSLISGPAPVDPDTDVTGFPAFAWEMNYYADGTIGGPIRFEIDNTALHLWAVVVHAAALPAADRKKFVDDVWPTFKNALDLLIRWRNPENDLQALANEDDQLTLSSTLHGSTAVYAALVAGARLANFEGDRVTAQAALGRSEALQKAIVANYYDSTTGLFVNSPLDAGADGSPEGGGTDSGSDNAGSTALGDTAWLVWPARVLEASDPRLEAQLVHDMTEVLRDVRGETQGAAYDMKTVVAAALLGKASGSRDMAMEAVQRLASIATPDTLHFGEVFVTLPGVDGGPPTFSERVATPHVWEGTLFYLSAMALSMPDRFDPEIVAFPLPAAPVPAGVTPPGGCGACSAVGEEARETSWPSWGLGGAGIAALAAFRAVRRKRARPWALQD
jgi:glycosyl hydrolase family 15